ncbi:NAD(P)-binding protein [Calocera viscosa TUFC12733]|uniref:NAD(P)-binding protein n=1 Tax=Calocera viscosa (strain TUFC12733) TaxID=1330018 RepID=A0A167H0A3_CALVF|nr:NAD(P)-binding protein [Calocera viscosa TUFC12733]
MHVLVLGASGRTGSLVVSQALQRKDRVTALVRNPDKFQPAGVNLNDPLLRVIKGTPVDKADLRKAFSGYKIDGVVVALNSTRPNDMPWTKPTSPTNMIETAVNNVVAEMTVAGTKRISLVSSWGVGSSYPTTPFPVRIAMMYTNLNYTHQALTLAEEALFKAPPGIEWAIARPSALGDGKPDGQYKVTDDCRGCRWAVDRALVARFCLDALQKDDWVNKAVVVT